METAAWVQAICTAILAALTVVYVLHTRSLAQWPLKERQEQNRAARLALLCELREAHEIVSAEPLQVAFISTDVWSRSKPLLIDIGDVAIQSVTAAYAGIQSCNANCWALAAGGGAVKQSAANDWLRRARDTRGKVEAAINKLGEHPSRFELR